MSAKPTKQQPRAATIDAGAEGAHRNGEWSGSVSAKALDADAILLFVSNDDVGSGPSLHVHPYDEVFIVTEGRARFTVGDRTIDAAAGDVVTGPANVPHKYENLGPGRLRTTDIHLSRVLTQTDLHDPVRDG